MIPRILLAIIYIVAWQFLITGPATEALKLEGFSASWWLLTVASSALTGFIGGHLFTPREVSK